MNMKKKILSMLALLAVATTGAWADDDPINLTYDAQTDKWTLASMPAYDVELEIEYYATTPFDLTVGESLHGTVAFSVGGAAATQAIYSDVVTVTVTPEEGYSTKDVTVRAYTSWESAGTPRRTPSLQDEIEVSAGTTAGTWTFTMPEANVWVVVTYTKNLQDSWIQAIADQTYTGIGLTPAIVVKDGETTLVINTDYTVEYSNNINVGEATVTVTGTGNYSGTATATFNILANKSNLNTAITDAETYYNSIKDSNPDAAAALLTAINTAKGVQSNADATQEQVEAAISALATAQTTAEQAVLAETKTELNTAITDAETYYNSIKDSNPDAAADLLTAINAAKGVQGNNDATQEQVEAALSALAAAVTTATVEVSRIEITIPAKSYVTRIDADKRQIETAVSGVSLYSVASVTNKEVVLTAALNVVAAEMPFLIYNNNDEAKTVNIILSTGDADAVTYDSNHFKGTLTAKTFSAADMQAADHYVLSNGHSFVWVKDAGTLAANKCWIELAKAAGASSLSIVPENDGFTGISLTQALSEGEGVCYDLSGRRVAKPAKGLYIVNGKKIVVK